MWGILERKVVTESVGNLARMRGRKLESRFTMRLKRDAASRLGAAAPRVGLRYSAFGLALRAYPFGLALRVAVANASGVQRVQSAAL
jgi:hypothetical protein